MKIRLMKNVAFAFLGSALLFSLPTGGFAADNVVSADIKEADGTSGQDTNAGAGVKTGHIQDVAVTAPKLATGSVATDKIADGAVTDAKISGTISTSKLNVGTSAGTVAAGDHAHDAIYQRKSANVKVVALDGSGDFTSPVDAMNSITDASATNPYLVKIMPGVYDIGGSFETYECSVHMKEYVDIEGSGEHVTKITGGVKTNGTSVVAVVVGASNAELRQLTVETRGSYDSNALSTTIWNDGTSPRIKNVTVLGTGTMHSGIKNTSGAAPTIEDVTVDVDSFWTWLGLPAGGILINNSSPRIENCGVTFRGPSNDPGVAIWGASSPVIHNMRVNVDNGNGIYVQGGAPMISGASIAVSGGYAALAVLGNDGVNVVINNSSLQGGPGMAWGSNDGENGFTVKIATTKLVGSFSGTPGKWTCVGDYDQDFAALGADCH